DQLHKPPTHGRRVSFREQSLGGLAEIEIWAGEPSQQLFSAFTVEVEAWGARRIPVAHPIEPSTQPIDPLGIAVGVLVAVITIVPVEDVEAAVGTKLLRDRHEPGIVGGEKS